MSHRILICSNLYPPGFLGGAELIAQRQAESLSELGNSVFVFSGSSVPPRQRYDVWCDTTGTLPVFRVQLNELDFWVRSSASFFDRKKDAIFDEVVRLVKPDIVHFHNLNGLSAGMIQVAKANRARAVLTVHDHWAFCFHNTLLKTGGTACVDRRDCQNCLDTLEGDKSIKQIPASLRNEYIAANYGLLDAIISPSRYLAGAYSDSGFGSEKIHVIPNGVPGGFRPRARRFSLSSPVEFLFVGYMGPHKGVDFLLQTFAGSEFLNGARLQLVGEGHLNSQLEEMVRALNLTDRVRFGGRVDPGAMPDVLHRADCLILPSLWPENHPNVIAEAATMGVPVIASRIGGIPEMVDDGKTGLLFRAGDGADLASKMVRVIRDPELAPALGRNGRLNLVSNSCLQRVRQIEEVYELVMGRARRARAQTA